MNDDASCGIVMDDWNGNWVRDDMTTITTN